MSEHIYLSARPNFVQFHFKVREMNEQGPMLDHYEASVVRHADNLGCNIGVTEWHRGKPKAFQEFDFKDNPGSWKAAEKVAIKAIELFRERIRK